MPKTTIYVPGRYYYCDGLDMQCRLVRVRVRLVRILDKREREAVEGRYDCVTEGRPGGVRCYGCLSELSPRR
jgi:hypothetical protein